MTNSESLQQRGATRVLGEWMSAVAGLVRAVNTAVPVDDLLDRIADHACRLIGLEYCAVMLADPSGAWLRVRGSSGLARSYVEALNREHVLVIDPDDVNDETVAASSYHQGVTLVVSDLSSAADYGASRRWARTQGFTARALIAAPLLGSTGPAGVIVAYSTERTFTSSEVELVELLAQHAVLALETAELRAAQSATIDELQRHRHVLELAEVQHRRLMQLLLDEAGLQRLAESLSEALQVSITIEDATDAVLAVAPAGSATPPTNRRWRRRTAVRAAIRSLHERFEVVPLELGASGEHGWVAPVVLGGQLVGQVWGTGVDALPDPSECRVIERFALVVGVELLKRRYRVETQNRLVGDLVDELLRTDAELTDAMLERATVLGHDLTGPQVLAVVTADADLGGLVDPVRSSLLGSPRPLVGRHGEVLVVIVPAEPDPLPALTAVHHRVAALAESSRVATILGPRVTGSFGEALAPTLAAARLCAEAGTDHVLDLRDLGLAAHLLRVGTTNELCSFVDALLGPVEEYDRSRGTQLCPTLRTWLKGGCSVPTTAREMTLHPNTVAYRLQRAERLLGRELRTTALRMELQLAFTVRDIQVATRPS